MSDYTKTVDFAAKDALTPGDANKLAKGTEVGTEFDNIATAVATKSNKVAVPTTNNLLKQSATGDLVDADSITDDGSEVEITTGNTFNVKDASGLKIADVAVTSTAAELNILDGVTSTAAELNELDASAAAVTEFQDGIRYWVHDNSASKSSLDVLTNIGATFESVGPTGSSATNIWTEMDGLPADTQAVVIRIVTNLTTSTGAQAVTTTVSAQKTGESSEAVGSTATDIHRVGFYAATTAYVGYNVTETVVPVDGSVRFDLAYVTTGTNITGTCVAYLVGFIA